ncbi:alpha/beta hydrolase [Bradyrhizobium sp. SSBR45G]|uniref:alpha/beta fold hydrolase n=1 Tax=unclassified Bradyrhizobium TaxID=2631580 RepID=UPI002342AD6B|nr:MULTISPECIES: alpha/beta hydrolase [unclassified Bradyrhizobium]GLH77180.1 alpha/beta hydrolase [Bradyrhizobium sp. SSBR45G]GLH83938.1 alpha/beta hydrolase [Bradyrhizobium sp. SSBR45R]
MQNIVLVHGAWVDGASWQSVYRILDQRGYAVSIVQNPLTSLEDDVAAARRVLDRQSGPALLVGHSYGGAVITHAGVADNVAGLVYVAAFVPDIGESVTSLLGGGPAAPLQLSQDNFLFFDTGRFPQAFAHDCGPSQAAFLAASQVPIAARALGTPLSQAAWKSRPCFYLLTTDDRIIPPLVQRQMASRARAELWEVAASHAVHISRPMAVADAIDQAARNTIGRPR